jgi:AcrR family transcriptional regulator
MNVIQQDKEGRRHVVAKGAGVKRNRSGELTRQKIIDAAAGVFAEKGVEIASLREIMIAAGVNIAAVNYYFGSKADLLSVIIAERTEDLNNHRVALLDAAKRRNNGPPSIEDWLHALIGPFVEVTLSTDPGWRNYLRILNWLTITREEEYRQVVAETYNMLRHAFLDALTEILPNLSDEEVAWRFHSVIAVLRSALADRERIAVVSGGAVDPDDFPRIMNMLVPFLAAGLRLPPVLPKPPMN